MNTEHINIFQAGLLLQMLTKNRDIPVRPVTPMIISIANPLKHIIQQYLNCEMTETFDHIIAQ